MGDLRILILEDVEADAALIETELRRADLPFTSRLVGDKPAFLGALDEFQPHAILSDYKLPAFSGIEALREVRGRGLDAAFIIITGSQTEEVVAECFKLGADDYLLKASLTRLPGALLNALHRRQADLEGRETLARLQERERQLAEAQALAQLGRWERDHVSGAVTWSDELCRIWGFEPGGQPEAEPLSVRIHPDDVDLLRWADSEIAAGRSFELVFRIQRPDGQVRTLRCRQSVHTDESRKPIRSLGTVLDITDLRGAMENLHKSESRFAKVFQQNPAAISLVTADEGRILDVNEKYASLLGYRPDEMVGRSVYELGVWADADVRRAMIQRLRTSGSVRGLETRLRRKNGELLDVLMFMEILKLDEEPITVTMFTDVSALKRTEAELRRSREELQLLARGLQAIREEERTHMAREIHDQLGQALTAIKMDLSWINQRLRRDQRPLAQRSKAVMQLTDSTIDAVRRLSAELRPAVLDDLGLPAAVEWVVEDYHRRSGVDVALQMQPDVVHVSSQLATAAFRILQEALTNVARHAAARHVWVLLDQRDHALTLEVRDDGRGLTADPLQVASLGVLGMRERAAGVGGELTLSGAPGRGTVVRARFPVESAP